MEENSKQPMGPDPSTRIFLSISLGSKAHAREPDAFRGIVFLLTL
jgi:hypothetical protein